MTKREKRVQEKKKARKERLIQVRKADNKRAKLEHLYREKRIPIMKNPPDKSNKDEDIKQRINHNMKILEALEEEYKQEIESKKNLNTDLESEGFYKLSDKMVALSKKERKSTAETKFIPSS